MLQQVGGGTADGADRSRLDWQMKGTEERWSRIGSGRGRAVSLPAQRPPMPVRVMPRTNHFCPAI